MKLALGILAFALLAGTAKADQVWSYQGNSTSAQGVTFGNPCGCALSGTADFAVDGSLVSYSFTDGTHTLTNLNSIGSIIPSDYGPSFAPFTQAWTLVLFSQTQDWELYAKFYGSFYEETEISFPSVTFGNSSGPDFLYVQGNKGTWTDPVGTPEPSALLLILMFGLLAFIGRVLHMVHKDFRERVAKLEAKVWEPLA